VALRHLLLETGEEAAQLRVGEEGLFAAAVERVGDAAIARDVPPVEQAGGGGQVVAGGGDQIVDAHHLMADGYARVPQRIEQRVGDGGRLRHVGGAEPHVEIALERDRAAPVAAHAGERHRAPCARGHGASRVEHSALQAAEERRQEVVEDARIALAERHPGALERQLSPLGRDAVEQIRTPQQRGAEALDGPRRSRRGEPGGHRGSSDSTPRRSPVPRDLPARGDTMS
jgi:hypothetical protein